MRRYGQLFPKVMKHSQLVVAAKGSSIVGFVAYDLEQPLVYFAHVAKNYRRLGLCTILLAGLERPFTYAMDNDYARKVAAKLGGIFDPFAWTQAVKED
jgi:hypothetical protein